jgi:pimeloyl-ACP methyl ester carboxylesterase
LTRAERENRRCRRIRRLTDATDADWTAIAPFSSGRWDAVIQARQAQDECQQNQDAAAVFYSAGAIDADAIRSALAELRAPVLLIAGEYDVVLPPKCAAEYTALFRQAETAVQSGGGHYPWLDNPEWFTRTLAEFLLQPAS